MKKPNIFDSINFLYKKIDYKRRLQLFSLILLNIINGLLEFTTLYTASLFLESLSNPLSVSKKINWTKDVFSFFPPNILLQTTILFISIILLSTLLRIFNLWISMRFRVSLLVFLEAKIFNNIINQELEYHINNSSTNIINDLTKNIDKANFFIENLLSLITCTILSLSLVIGLLTLNYAITICTVLILAILYISIGIITSKKISLYGRYELKSTKDFLQIIQESLGAMKEIILSRNHKFFIQ